MESSQVKITIIPNGPARVHCKKAELTLPDGSTVTRDGDIYLCRCGASRNKPLCDASHKTVDFKG